MKHILIDYENIQPKNFDEVETDDCHIWLFLGVNQQKTLPLALVENLLKFDNKYVHIIKMLHSGKNALDFYLSFYLGKISEIDSKADICILARDSGYDVLVEHLNNAYDGMTIMRSTNADQLTLACKSNRNTASGIDNNQIIIDDNQHILCDNSNSIAPENKNDLSQSIENGIPKMVIHDCYILVFDSIVNRKVFLPSYKSNLLYWMKRYVPVTMLERFNSMEQDYIFEQVFEKFIKAGLICIDSKNEKLTYKVDNQGILELVTAQVLLSKAKTVNGLNNVVKQKLASYRQPNSEEQIHLIITWLKTQGMIKQDNQSIYYPTCNDIKVDERKSKKDSKVKGANTIYQRVITIIKNRPNGSRPTKKVVLINYLQSHLRNELPKVIENVVKQMISNGVITITDDNKLSYKI